jgi:hypothetical protein
MISIPVCMEFPRLRTSIYAFVRLRDATFQQVFDAIVNTRGWLPQEDAAQMANLSTGQFSLVAKKCDNRRHDQLHVRRHRTVAHHQLQ